MAWNIYGRLSKIFLCFMIVGSINSVKATEYLGTLEWNGEKYVGDWNGLSSYKDGWSEWTEVTPDSYKGGKYSAMYVKAKVYLKAIWPDNDNCTTGGQTVIKVGNTVRQNNRNYTLWEDGSSYNIQGCSEWNLFYQSNKIGKCNCVRDEPDRPTRYCSKPKYNGRCDNDGGVTRSKLCGTDPKYSQQCYFYKCGTNINEKGWNCTGNYNQSSQKGDCTGRQDWHCYKTTSNFDTKWYKSLSEAGGYAKEVYIYSYPTRVYLDYNGNGFSLICGDGITSNWKAGTNTGCNTTTGYNCNANLNIQYEKGNPVCNNKDFKEGKMISSTDDASVNNRETTYINYATGGNLRKNQYYKIGYDFKGWNTKPNGSGIWFRTDGMHINASDLNARPGERITLYAQWKKHTYNVSYSFNCGYIQNVTYKYGEGVNLKNLDTNSCKANGANTTFLGWYEHLDGNGNYTSKITKIPTSYYKDITLYARLRETRYFNYQTGSWEYTK